MDSFLHRCVVVLALTLAISGSRLTDARHGPNQAYRHTVSPFSGSECVVQKWPSCISACPTNSTLPAVMLGKLGANVGKFLATSIQEYPNQSIESCCKACTAFNDVHWNNIFGYVCDFWSWQQVKGFSGHCQLFDMKSLCGSAQSMGTKMFNVSRTDTVSFPVLC